ncbi:hypothetical protein [Streptomyces aquilus]|uniref:hypothetical protein n=1 Tax=Streptomyces aquilus TaxID=2548456 RepID=UPI0036B44AD3
MRTSTTRRRTAQTIVGAVAALALSAALPVTAHAATTKDPQVQAALTRIGDGTWTQADLDLIKTKAPDIAGSVIDPTAAGSTVTFTQADATGMKIPADGPGEDSSTDDQTTSTPLTDSQSDDDSGLSPGGGATGTESGAIRTKAVTAAAAGSPRQEWIDVYYTRKSLLGSTIYKYHHKIWVTYNGSKVTSWGKRKDFLTNPQEEVDEKERTENDRSGVPASAVTSHMKRHISLVAPVYGEYANLYPWITIKVHGNGSYSYTGHN